MTHAFFSLCTDPHWMLLFIDSDQKSETGWMGYDYLVNLEVRNDKETSVKAWQNNKWTSTAKANYRVNGNGMEISISRKDIGQTRSTPAFDFHWADNIQRLDDVAEFGINGDSAPNRRWNYRFETNN